VMSNRDKPKWLQKEIEALTEEFSSLIEDLWSSDDAGERSPHRETVFFRDTSLLLDAVEEHKREERNQEETVPREVGELTGPDSSTKGDQQ
jgi:hypothetical protein